MTRVAAPLVLVLGLLATAACGGTVVFEAAGDGGGGAGGGGDVDAVNVASSGSGSTTSGSGVSTGAVGSSGVATVGSGGGGNNTGEGVIPLSAEVNLVADCMPEVSDDPVQGSIVVTYTNEHPTNAGSIDLNQTEIFFANEWEGWSFPIALLPISSGLVQPGETVVTEHVKRRSDFPIASICQLCGMDGVIAMRWDVGPVLQVPFTLACAL